MAKKRGKGGKRGRPKADAKSAKTLHLDMRLGVADKKAFKDAAELAGLPLSAWIRERLRTAARKELEGAGRPVAFLCGTSKGDA